MDALDEELLKFWKLLNQNKVKYIMIGGFAVNLHGFSRTTGDLDIWLKDDINNRKKLGKAFHARLVKKHISSLKILLDQGFRALEFQTI